MYHRPAIVVIVVGICIVSLHPLIYILNSPQDYIALHPPLKHKNEFVSIRKKNTGQQDPVIKLSLPNTKHPLSRNTTSAIGNHTENFKKNSKITLEKESHNFIHKGQLDCSQFGGPSTLAANDVVYWKEIPSDMPVHQSPLTSPDDEQYLIFEVDESGWNNARMAFETVVGMAIAMGRTLVMPPKLHFSYYWDSGMDPVPVTILGFEDYLTVKFAGLKIISLKTFLETISLQGRFIDVNTGKPTYPPDNNRTDWTGLIRNYHSVREGPTKTLYQWLRNVSTTLKWNYDVCVAAFPSSRGPDGSTRLQTILQQILEEEKSSSISPWERVFKFTNNPTAVNATVKDRLREILSNRRELCVYDETYQNAQVIHVYGEQMSGYRMLIHFYAFLFMEDWKLDLHMKRIIRDRIRYSDQLQCAAARIVNKIRQSAIYNGQADGTFDTFHIRRNDFKQAYGNVVLSAEDIFRNHTSNVIEKNRTIYISTDETDLSFFLPLREHYNLVFLRDFLQEIKDVIPNFYGPVEQLVAAKGDVFFGTMYSTFSGYINRLRGYYADRSDGTLESYYIVPTELDTYKKAMKTYMAVSEPFWGREYPIGWRDIDNDITKQMI